MMLNETRKKNILPTENNFVYKTIQIINTYTTPQTCYFEKNRVKIIVWENLEIIKIY
jgi:hypothetical protein